MSPATAARLELDAVAEGDTVPDAVFRLIYEPAPEEGHAAPDSTSSPPWPANATSDDEERCMTRAEAELVGEYRFRRLQGHQPGCQCQSRGDYLGCRDLRARLLAAGEWRALH